MISAAIWSAVSGWGLTYAEPPKSFEQIGQKIRGPQRVAVEGLATCLDLSLLLCGALEAAGLNSAVIFTRGHAFAGVWLIDRTFSGVVEPDVTEVRKAMAANEFIAFETTLLTKRPPAGFEQAIKDSARQLSEALEENFAQAIDIARARSAGITPLASHAASSGDDGQDSDDVAPVALPKLPDFGRLPGEFAEEEPKTPDGRIARWQRKLLDLSLRNKLINFADTKSTVPFLCPDISGLEDSLADGKSFRLISLPDENPVGDRDPELFKKQTGEDIHAGFALKALSRREICVPLEGRDMSRRLVALDRKARSDLSEGGANTLFLAAGFLRWKKSPEDRQDYRAPLLLIPVKLKRQSANADFRLSHLGDEVRFNATLLQLLERDFGVKVSSLAGELPTDHAGYDVPRIFELMRAAVRDAPGFEVVEELSLSTFSFAKYLMWKDLVDRTDSLRENRLVRHLIDNPEKPFSGDGFSLPRPEDVDRRPAASFVTPLPADSSQLSAVIAASEGHDFVIIGPPGTGKSQTIANMIAQVLATGKTVLFVAEKSAALDVVYRRLKAHGLADACLELHSNHTDRRQVISQLGKAWDRAAHGAESEWVEVTNELTIRRDELNGYVDALHKSGSHGCSVYTAIGLIVARSAPFKLSWPALNTHDVTSFRSLFVLAERLGQSFEAVKDCGSLGPIAPEGMVFPMANSA